MSRLKAYTPSVGTLAPHPNDANALAARSLNLVDAGSDRKYVHHLLGAGALVSHNAWKWYDEIGEVRYGISRSARIAGYGILQGARVSIAGMTLSKADAGVLAEEVAKIYSPYGSTRHLLERYYTLLKLPADMWLVRCRNGGGEDGYLVLSSDEIERDSLDSPGPIKWKTTMSSPDGGSTTFEREIAREDFLGRVWNASARWIDIADSPMTGLATECEVLHLLTQTMKGRLMSRFAMAGILLLPQEMSDAAIAGPDPNKTLHTSKVLNYLITAWTRNMSNHDQSIATLPIALQGPAAVLDKVKHLMLDTAIDERDLKLRTELIGRILTGLDVQKNATQGVGDTNHWAAWAVSDEERRIAVQPDIDAFSWVLTRLILWPALRNRGWEEGKVRRVRVIADLSEAAVKTNQAEDFRLLRAEGGVSLEALRRVSGAKESDKPDNDEYVRWFGAKHADPYLAFYGLEGIDVDYDKVGMLKRPTGPIPGPDDADRGPGVGDPGSPDDRETDTPRTERPA
jgi:hypothetical protein